MQFERKSLTHTHSHSHSHSRIYQSLKHETWISVVPNNAFGMAHCTSQTAASSNHQKRPNQNCIAWMESNNLCLLHNYNMHTIQSTQILQNRCAKARPYFRGRLRYRRVSLRLFDKIIAGQKEKKNCNKNGPEKRIVNGSHSKRCTTFLLFYGNVKAINRYALYSAQLHRTLCAVCVHCNCCIYY